MYTHYKIVCDNMQCGCREHPENVNHEPFHYWAKLDRPHPLEGKYPMIDATLRKALGIQPADWHTPCAWCGQSLRLTALTTDPEQDNYKEQPINAN